MLTFDNIPEGTFSEEEMKLFMKLVNKEVAIYLARTPHDNVVLFENHKSKRRRREETYGRRL